MTILLQNTLLLKEFVSCNGCFGLFTKTKKGSGTSFRCTFCAWFFHKNVHKGLSIQKFSVSHFCSFSRYQIKCIIKFLFRQLMMSWTLRFIFDHPLKQWSTGKRGGEDGNFIFLCLKLSLTGNYFLPYYSP